MSFHINPETGDPGKCSASKGKCPFGGTHYDSEAEARAGYEELMANPFGSPAAQKHLHEEKLLPELEEYVTDGPLGRFLNHPLVQDMMVDAMPGFANIQLRQKKASLAKAIENKNWNQYINIHERPYRFDALQELIDRYEPENADELIRDAWIDSENIHQNFDGWYNLIESNGIAMSEEDAKVYRELPEQVTVYRGCSPLNEEGFSWTLDQEKAEWFANRFSRAGSKVMKVTVPKSEIVAYLGGRGESEVILYPDNLSDFNPTKV